MEGGFGTLGALFEAPVVKVKPFDEAELDFFLGLDGDFAKEPEESLFDYLQKEQIIFSMLREKKKKELVFNEDIFFETLSSAAMKKHPEPGARYEYVKKVVTRDIIVPMLNEIKKKVESSGVGSIIDFGELGAIVGEGAEIRSLFSDEIQMLEAVSLRCGIWNPVGIEICSPSGEMYTLLLNGTLKKTYREGGRVFRSNRKGRVYYHRDAVSLAGLWIKKKVSELFRKHIEELTEEELEDDSVYQSFLSDARRMIVGRLKCGEDMIYLRSSEGEYGLPKGIRDRELVPRILDEFGERYCIVPDSEPSGSELGKKTVDGFDMAYMYGLYAAADPDMTFSDFNEDGTRVFSWSTAVYAQESEVKNLLSVIYDAYTVKKERVNEFRAKENVDRADVYQTKKNIPRVYLKAMEESRFNDAFGFVEIDADCDLGLMPELEKEFRALRQPGLLGNQECRSVAIRFRKLHRYRADGLYWPNLQCLCVDVRNPSTFTHEFFHMVDYERGHLSEGFRFLQIRAAYEQILRRDMKKLPKGQREKLEGTSKYNLNYYLTPTEVFARCGEIYMTRIRSVNNSLCRPEDGFAYPPKEGNEALYELIGEYYDKLLDYNPDKGREKGEANEP